MHALEFPVPFTLDRSRSAAAQVFDHLRAMIISLEMKPGTVLPRAELADYFALSLTPIRDALLRLEEEGLVDIFPQHATVVRPIDVNSARQAHFLRMSVELEVVHTLASTRGLAPVAQLRDLIMQQRSAFETEDFEGFAMADLAFHRLMYQTANVESLWSVVRSNSGNLDRLRHLHLPIPGKAIAVMADHNAIVDAIAAGSPSLAQHALRAHLSGTLSHLEDIRSRHPDYLLDSANTVVR